MRFTSEQNATGLTPVCTVGLATGVTAQVYPETILFSPLFPN